jgi:hypothetical protein
MSKILLIESLMPKSMVVEDCRWGINAEKINGWPFTSSSSRSRCGLDFLMEAPDQILKANCIAVPPGLS